MTVAKYGTKSKLIRCYLGLNKKIKSGEKWFVEE